MAQRSRSSKGRPAGGRLTGLLVLALVVTWGCRPPQLTRNPVGGEATAELQRVDQALATVQRYQATEHVNSLFDGPTDVQLAFDGPDRTHWSISAAPSRFGTPTAAPIRLETITIGADSWIQQGADGAWTKLPTSQLAATASGHLPTSTPLDLVRSALPGLRSHAGSLQRSGTNTTALGTCRAWKLDDQQAHQVQTLCVGLTDHLPYSYSVASTAAEAVNDVEFTAFNGAGSVSPPGP